MRLYVHLLVCLMVLPFMAGAQTATLRGQVFDAVSNQPLPFTNVFLTNTTRGATTQENGSFELTGVPVGKFDLVVSYVGYQPLRFTVQTDDNKFYRIGLTPDAQQLAAVTVRAKSRRDADWDRNVELFKKYFIGNSDNASLCRLLNPEVLYFKNTDDSLIAHADEPLLIENRALGYHLKYFLRSYHYDHRQHRIQFEGEVVYEPLEGTEKQVSRWAENRRRAYRGSAMHFLRALYLNRLTEEGFVVQEIKEQPRQDGGIRRLGLPGDTTVVLPALNGKYDVTYQTLSATKLLDSLHSTPEKPVVAFEGLRQVTYTREPESYRYIRTLPISQKTYRARPQQTLIRMTQPRATLERNGYVSPSMSFNYEGYWTWKLMAEELPLDYEPE
ncbi:carboxypeptidase-like regulatory domain-containing protein [Telluribacter humicola]|uniref:carboxypeptidase-like regulatory domain-containing protein n=1 Tax=Telluribacter humicola TaxID=1720261 RepID=UPI001A95C15F|nr:carboxypeptidase-like regulatory domain-containing protein [Telluribacter humicola]